MSCHAALMTIPFSQQEDHQNKPTREQDFTATVKRYPNSMVPIFLFGSSPEKS